MALYLDTCGLVALLPTNRKHRAQFDFLTMQAASSLSISDWVITKFSCALSVKLRNKQLDARERNAALALFADLLGSITIVPITTAIFQEAAMLANVSTTGLRAGDALHLSVAPMSGTTLITFDRKLGSPPQKLG